MPTPIADLLPDSARDLLVAQDCARSAVDGRILGLMEGTVAGLIGVPGVPGATPTSQMDADLLSFFEQFVIDVSGITDDQRAALGRHVPEDEQRAFVSAFYLVEFSMRLNLMADRLDLSVPERVEGISAGRDVVDALREYQNSVMREFTLDPMTTEMVRLRCARVHNCRICKTLRLDRAHSVGVDESMTDKVDFYESSDLSPRIKRALRITDAFITRPDTLDDETARDAVESMAPDLRASLLLSITKWSTQKVHVSLGTDAADRLPISPQGVSYFDFEEDGTVAGYSAVPS